MHTFLHSSPEKMPPGHRLATHQRPSWVGYYAHRVQESLTARVSKIICTIVLGLLLIAGVIAFLLWLSLRPHRPRFHILDFTVPGMGHSAGFHNAQVTFNMTLRNPNLNIGIENKSMEGSVYYKDQRIAAKPFLEPHFYQGPKNTTIVDGSFCRASVTVSSRRWAEFLSERVRGSVGFRLQLTSVIRFKISSWYSKRHHIHATCNVRVDHHGKILETSKNKRCQVYFTS